MPIPAPNSNETRDEFISRCMGDSVMVTEYPDVSQRYRVCSVHFAKNKNGSNELSFEVFAVGLWNGLEFDKKRLQKIVDNFKKLKEVHKPYLKIGHEDTNPSMGQPALGWIDDMWLTAANKIMVHAVGIPDKLFNAIKNKLYKRVSIELSVNVEYKGQKIGDVLDAVAILGADVPAVNTLQDLDAYMTRPPGNFAGASRAMFTAIQTNEGEIMPEDVKALSEKIDKMMGRVDEVEKENRTLREQNQQLSGQVEKFQKDEKTRLEDEKKNAVKMARDKVDGILEKAVKDQKIAPAQREQFKKLLQVDDDEMVQRVDFTLLDQMISKGSASFSTDDTAASSGKGKQTDGDRAPDEIVFDRCSEMVNKKEAPDLFTAMEMVFRKDPELAIKYRDMNVAD